MIAWTAAGAMAGAAVGAIAGSFLSTLILRWPQGLSIARGRSRCDGCGRVLTATDLIPLVPRRACRTCGGAIDPLHRRFEWACAAIGLAALITVPAPAGFGWALLGWLLLTLAILDARHFWLPDALTLPLAAFGLVLGGWATGAALSDRLIGGATGWLSLWALAFAYLRLRGREGLGLGDAKLLGALGCWFGWAALAFILLCASVAALLALAIGRAKVSRDTRVPLGTYLCLGALPGWLLARALVAA